MLRSYQEEQKKVTCHYKYGKIVVSSPADGNSLILIDFWLSWNLGGRKKMSSKVIFISFLFSVQKTRQIQSIVNTVLK